MSSPAFLVFTDLDGTLLDHETYSYLPARPCLQALREQGIPVALASSKTAAEIVPLRAELGFDHVPAVCENGAGLVPAHAADAGGGARYLELRAALAALPAELRLPFEGFGDMGEERLAEVTGLSPAAASRARARDFSEPGLWSGTAEDRAAFVETLRAQGVTARFGGRFLTLSFGGTKADRMAEIAATYGSPPTIALGDAPNDAEMIGAADHGVIVANPEGHVLPRLDGEAAGRIIRTARPGPAGWAEAVTAIAATYGITL